MVGMEGLHAAPSFQPFIQSNMSRLNILLSACVLLLSSCKERIDTSARYVFTENTVMSYLEKHPEDYSTYVDLLHRVPVSSQSETTMGQLLSARGHYTVFPPTNEAITAYLDTLVVQGIIPTPSWEAFSDSAILDSIRKVIVYNSIIDSGDNDKPYYTYDFPSTQGGEIVRPNMYDRKLTVYRVSDDADAILIFNKFPINNRNRDILVLNGVIHQMEGVIAPKNITASVYLQDIIDHQRVGFLVMARAIQACGLMDTLNAVRDEIYEMEYKMGNIPDIDNMNSMGSDLTVCYAPEHRYYGFTIFAETDDFWRSQGIDPTDQQLLEKLIRWILDNNQYAAEDVFTTDDHYSDPGNLLNQWTTYHILPQRMAANKLVGHSNEIGYNLETPDILSIACEEFYTTMGARRLLKVYESRESDGVWLNRFPNLDNKRTGGYHELSCDPDKVGCKVMREDERAVLSDITNCNIYPLDAPLSYNDATRTNLMRQRLRFDLQTLFPEAITNDIRLNGSNDWVRKFVYAPSDNVYRYFSNLWQERDTYTCFCDYGPGNPSNMADEIKSAGRYDITILLPPVPKAGTYELRYAILPTSYRGVCQLYLSTDLNRRVVTGIPIDMRVSLKSMGVWEADTEDQDYNAEVDKRMRTLGYMKGCQHAGTNGRISESLRVNAIRQVISRRHMLPEVNYYLTFKNVLDAPQELYLDYFELVAKEVYDNPETPEDIW